MDSLNFKMFLQEQEAEKSQGGPFDALQTVVGMSPKDAAKVLEVPSYIADKVAGDKQIAATVGNMKPRMVRGKLIGAKITINPRITQKTGSNPIYIKNAVLKQGLDKIIGAISANTTGDLATLGFPSTGAGGVA